jgi:hypothetical protein
LNLTPKSDSDGTIDERIEKAMNRELFWQLLDDTRVAADGDPFEQGQHLTAALAAMTPEAIAEFDELAHEIQDQAYTAEAAMADRPGAGGV